MQEKTKKTPQEKVKKEEQNNSKNDYYRKKLQYKDENTKTRLKVLRICTYGFGIMYALLCIAIITLTNFDFYKSNNEMIITVTTIGLILSNLIASMTGTSWD